MDLNQSQAVGGNILGQFQGSLTNLGVSGRLQSQIQVIVGLILTFPDPPFQLGQIFLWYSSPNFGNTALRSFSSNVLYEMCPLHLYQPPTRQKYGYITVLIWIYHWSHLGLLIVKNIKQPCHKTVGCSRTQTHSYWWTQLICIPHTGWFF